MSPQDYHQHENFYTYEEIKDFTNDFRDLTILNITKFIETKTRNSYTVVSIEFIKDVNRWFIEHEMLIVKFAILTNNFWEEQGGDNNKVVTKEVIEKLAKMNNEIWEELKDYNKNLISKHEELLNTFKLKDGK